MSDDSELTGKGPCPFCPSSDAFATYTDGHGYCFSCGRYQHGLPLDGGHPKQRRTRVAGLWNDDEYDAQFAALISRGISDETCRKFGYKVGIRKGKRVHVAPYFKDNQLVAQKVRFVDKKEFIFNGEGGKKAPLFGMNLWRDGGKKIVITEGEIDCMTVSQLQGNKWPVVSVPNGAQGAKASLASHLEWLEKFETIVLMFDMDEPGISAAQECALLFTPGRAKIASLPLKDANEMLLAGRGAEVITATWDAKDYRPPMVATVADCREDAIRMPTEGIPWPWPTLTALTYGIHRKKTYYLGAGVGIGKTNWAKELQSHLVNNLGLSVGVFMLEEDVGRTLKGIAGKVRGIPFHKPDAKFTQDQLLEAIDSLDGKVYLYRHDQWGTDWDSIKPAIRAMVHYGGVRDIFLDNLTVMVSHLTSSEANDEINRIAKEAAALVHELDISLYGFSHLNPPQSGVPHERGGKVHELQFTGSRGLMRYGHYLFGIERNKDPELSSDERNTSWMVLLKDREFGRVGRFPIFYNEDTDQYLEPPEGWADFINSKSDDDDTGGF